MTEVLSTTIFTEVIEKSGPEGKEEKRPAEPSAHRRLEKYLDEFSTHNFVVMTLTGKKPKASGWADKANEHRLVDGFKSGDNLGILTGERSGVTVVDIDVKDRGLEVWDGCVKAMSLTHRDLDPWVVRTGGGGLHMYFEYDAEIKQGDHLLQFGSEKVGWDVRNNGGYVVAPGSLHPESGKYYLPNVELYSLTDYIDDRHNLGETKPFEKMPMWLKDLLLGRKMLNTDYSISEKAVTERKVEKKVVVPITPGENKYDYVDIHFIEECVKMLAPERASGYDSWSQSLWAMKNTALEYRVDLRDMAHEFSKRTKKENYKAAQCDIFYDDATEGAGFTFASLRKWAEEDSPTEYNLLHREYLDIHRAPAVVGYYEDIKQLSTNPRVTQPMIEDWMRSCIYKVLKGGEPLWISRMRAGGWKMIKEPFKGTEDYTFNTGMKKKGSETMPYSKILKGLQQKACFQANIFSDVEFAPVPASAAPTHQDEKFNLFTGFKVAPAESKEDDPDLALVLNHFREVISADNMEYYNYVLNWFAHAFQRPHIKIGVVLTLIGPQESGKNILFDWIGEFIYGDMFHQLSSLDRLTQQFNAHNINKLFSVLNEIQSYGGSFKESDKLKTIISDKWQLIEPKGREAFKIADCCNYILLTNNDWPVRVESDDRRWACNRTTGNHKGDKAYFDRLGSVLNATTAAKFVGMLLRRDISTWNPRLIPATTLRSEMKVQSQSAPITFAIQLANNETDPEWIVDISEGKVQSKTVRTGIDTFYVDFIRWTAVSGHKYSGSNSTFYKDWEKLDAPALKRKTVRVGEGVCRGFLFTQEELRCALRVYLKNPAMEFEDE